MKKQRTQNPPINPQIGERLQLERRRLHLTQAEVATLAHMSPTVLCRLETGQQAVVAERLTAIAMVLGVSLDYLCGLERGLDISTPDAKQDALQGYTDKLYTYY